MIEGFDEMTLSERREALWGLRNGSLAHMNRLRREGFEAIKALITEKELPTTITHPPEGVLMFERKVSAR
jgi:hypothetical protein